MFINIFSSYPVLAQILCLLVVAGLIGYFLSYLISSKRINMKLKLYDQKIYKLESSLEDFQTIKDKQALLFDSKKELTLKVNELDALLGLTSEVDSISKTLNSLNFVPYNEFTAAVDGQNLEIEKFTKENKEVFNNSLEKSTQDIEKLKKSIPEQINKASEDWTNEIEMNKNNIKTLEAHKEDITKQLSEVGETKVRLEASLDEIKESNKALSETSNSRTEQFSFYDKKLETLKQNIEGASELISRLEKNEDLATHTAKEIQELLKLQTSVVDLKNDVFQSQKEILTNKEEIQSLAKSKATLLSKIDGVAASVSTDAQEDGLSNALSEVIEKQQDFENLHDQHRVDIKSIREKFMKNIKVSVKPLKTSDKKELEASFLEKLSIGEIDNSESDDLKLIKGIGPVLEKKINKLGICTFEQISQLSKADIKSINQEISLFRGKIQKEKWVTQAKKLLKQKEHVS